MAQSGYTPILIYASGTATNVPLAANMTSSASGAELALNYADGKLYYKNSSGVVTLLASATTVTNSFSAGTTGFTPSTATTGAVTLAGTLITSNGGTGLSSYTAGDLSYYASGTAFTKLAIGTAGQILTSSGTAPQWSTLSGVAVTTFSAGTTGFTPSTATSGAITLAGTLATTNGGTGLTSFTSGGVVYASSSSALATGSALTFNGTSTLTLNASAANLTLGISTNYGLVTAAGTNPASIYFNGGSRTGFESHLQYFGANHTFFNETGGSEIMRLLNTGNVLIGLSTALANGKLQVAGSIGLSGNTEIRQATNSDGNTLRLLATQVVVGAQNAQSYGYTGGGLLASVSNAGSAITLDVGGNTAGHRLQVVNDGTGQSGNLNYSNAGTSRFFVNSLSGNVGINNASPTTRFEVTLGDNEAATMTSASGTAAAIGQNQGEIRECGFNVTSGSNFVISDIVTTSTGWRVVLRGTFSNNYEGSGLSFYAPYIELNAANPSTTIGSRTLTVSRNGSGFLIVNSGDVYNISFAGTVEVYQNPQSPQPEQSMRLLGGIQFPATQNATSQANTLDDYEEGTWTVGLRGASSAGTYLLTANGTYTKIGNVVTVQAVISAMTVSSAGTGYAQITGLPFTKSANSLPQGAVYFNSVTLASLTDQVTWSPISESATAIWYFPCTRSGLASANLDITGFTSASSAYFSTTYLTS